MKDDQKSMDVQIKSYRRVIIVPKRLNQKFIEIYSEEARRILAEELAYHLSLPCDAFYTYQWKQLSDLCIKSKIYVNTILKTKCFNPSYCINLSSLVAKSISKWIHRHRVDSGQKGLKTERKHVSIIIPTVKRIKPPEHMTVDSLGDAIEKLHIGSYKNKKRDREMQKLKSVRCSIFDRRSKSNVTKISGLEMSFDRLNLDKQS